MSEERGGVDPLPCISPLYIYSSVKERVEKVERVKWQK
jgi:hypothetical protein